MPGRSNEEWVVSIQCSHTEALVELNEYLVEAVFDYLIRRSDLYLDREGTTQVAWDCAQKAMQKILMKIESYRPIGPFLGWARSIARNEAGQWMRKWNRQLRDQHPFESSTLADVRSIEQSIERKEILAVVEQALSSRLSDKERFVMREWYQWEQKPDEIAKRLGTTRAYVYKLHYTAKKKLREALHEAGFRIQ